VGAFEDCLEAENDVDDETMSGDNDVFNSNPGHNPSSLQMLSDLDSLTEPESLVMAAAAAAAANSQASHQQQASAAITQQSQQQLEDEMLLLRLMDIPSQQQLNVTAVAPGPTGGLPSSKIFNSSNRPAVSAAADVANSIIDSLQLDLGTPSGGSTSLSRLLSHQQHQVKAGRPSTSSVASASGGGAQIQPSTATSRIAPLPSFTPLDASYMSSKVTKDESHLKKAPTFQPSSGHQGLESNILFGANSGPISVMADTGGGGAASSVAISSSSTVLGSTTSTTTMPKQPSVLGSRGLIQEDTEPTIDGRDVSGLSPVVSTMMVMANPLQTCAGGPLPATTPLPTLVEASSETAQDQGPVPRGHSIPKENTSNNK